jgi:hypothetical protein
MAQQTSRGTVPSGDANQTNIALLEFTRWSLDAGEGTARALIQTLTDVLPDARRKPNLAKAVLDADDPQLKGTTEKTEELEVLLVLNEELLATIEQERADFFELAPGSETGRFRAYNYKCATRILHILNDGAAKTKQIAPTLQTKLFKHLEELQRQYEALPESLRG